MLVGKVFSSVVVGESPYLGPLLVVTPLLYRIVLKIRGKNTTRRGKVGYTSQFSALCLSVGSQETYREAKTTQSFISSEGVFTLRLVEMQVRSIREYLTRPKHNVMDVRMCKK